MGCRRIGGMKGEHDWLEVSAMVDYRATVVNAEIT